MCSVVSALVEFHFCLFASPVECSIFSFWRGFHLVGLIIYLVLTYILGCPSLCVLHHCLSSCKEFWFLCSLHDSVVTFSLLWIGLVKACIVSKFCTSWFLVVCIEIGDSVAILFWRLLPVPCDLWWYLPLKLCNNGKISLLYVLSLMLLYLSLRILLFGASFCGYFILPQICSSPASNPTPDAAVSKYRDLVSL